MRLSPALSARFADQLLGCVLCTAFLFILVVDHSGEITNSTVVRVSAVLCAASVVGFFANGKNYINASAVISFAILLFGGFAGIYQGLDTSGTFDSTQAPSVVLALTQLFALQVVLIWTGYRNAPCRPPSIEEVGTPIHDQVTIGVLFYLSTFVVRLVLPAQLSSQLAVIGIFLVADAILRGRTKLALLVGGISVAIMTYVYVEYIFIGFGRLVLAMLGMGMAMLVTLSVNWRLFKPLVIIAAVAALPILAESRLKYLAETRGSIPLESEGIGSVVGPLVSYSRIIDSSLSGGIRPVWGETYLNALTLWIPRSLWPSKPIGFGAEMVAVTQPHLAGRPGFSDAALFGGELVWNFGVLGAFLIIPVIVLLIHRLDKLVPTIVNRSGQPGSVLKRIGVVVLISSLIHFVWGGSNIYVGRMIVMVLVLGLLSITWGTKADSESVKRGSPWSASVSPTDGEVAGRSDVL